MANGWISIHRQLQNHWLWEDKPFSKGQAWIDLLLMANHDDSKFLLGNQLADAKRGDVVTSEVKLSERWGWSRTKVRSFLELLKNDSMIDKKSDSKKTVITIVNYGVWQDSQTAKEQQKDSVRTALEQQKNTINNDNNENKDNNISSCPANKFADDSIELKLSHELFNFILGNNSKAKEPNYQSWSKIFDLMIRIDKRSIEDIRKVMKWSQQDQFWQGNILSPAALRKQFDKLTIQMRTRSGQAPKDQFNKPSLGERLTPEKAEGFYL